MFGIIAKKKKVDGGQGDAVVVLVDGDHLVFGIIAKKKKKVDGGQGDAVVVLAPASVLTSHGSPLLWPRFPVRIPPLSSSSILVLMVNC